MALRPPRGSSHRSRPKSSRERERRSLAIPGRVARRWGRTMKRYILTGAPGAGKTAILRQLERDGYGVIEEAATDARRAEVTEQALRPFCGPWRGSPVGVERYDIWRTLTLIDVCHRLQQVRSIRRVVAEILPRGVLERCIRVNMANPIPDAPAELNKEDILLLQQIISSQTGSSVIYVGSTQLFQDINPTRRRHYVRCDFRRSNDEKLLHIFVKFGVTSRL